MAGIRTRISVIVDVFNSRTASNYEEYLFMAFCFKQKIRQSDMTTIYRRVFRIVKFLDARSKFLIRLGKLESFLLWFKLRKAEKPKPIYICGLARAGTTITSILLGEHPDTFTHQTREVICPYLPYLFNHLAPKTPFFASNIERLQQDGLQINPLTPHAVEEMIWMQFFQTIHDENSTVVLDNTISNSNFEQFYTKSIQKMRMAKGGSRYVTKNNYNVTRIEYLVKLFPDARFLIMIRQPENHIASLLRQDHFFCQMQPETVGLVRLLGHYECGQDRRLINVGNDAVIREIWELWQTGETVRGWARYWTSVYGFLADKLNENERLKKACMVVRYEDLCGSAGPMIDRILAHTGLPADIFQRTRNQFAKNLHLPTYYQPNLSDQELKIIEEETSAVASRFGYLTNKVFPGMPMENQIYTVC